MAKTKDNNPEEVSQTAEQETPEEELNPLQEQLSEAQERILRISAEYDNYKKRTAREKDELYAAAAADVLKKLLPVFDNLERAGACTDFDSLKAGVEMILNSFHTSLSACGVEEIEALGAQFDPNLHNAVLQEERDDLEENTVCDVLQKGYRMGEKLLRPSMVKVVK